MENKIKTPAITLICLLCMGIVSGLPAKPVPANSPATKIFQSDSNTLKKNIQPKFSVMSRLGISKNLIVVSDDWDSYTLSVKKDNTVRTFDLMVKPRTDKRSLGPALEKFLNSIKKL